MSPPEFPAPTLQLAAASGDGTDAHGGGPATSAAEGTGTPAAAGGASKGSVTGAYVVGGVGLLAGLAALGLAATRRHTLTAG